MTVSVTAAATEDEKEVVQSSLGLKDMFGKELRLITGVLFLAWPIGSSTPHNLVASSSDHGLLRYHIWIGQSQRRPFCKLYYWLPYR